MTFRLSATGTGTAAAGQTALLGGQSDLALVNTLAGTRVITSTGIQGGLTARDSTSLGYSSAHIFGAPNGRPGSGQLEAVTLAGRPALLSYGVDVGARLFWLDRAEPLAAPERLSFGSVPLTAISVLSGAAPGGGDLIFTSRAQGSGITLWQRSSNGAVTQIQQIAAPPGSSGLDILDLATLEHGGSRYLVAASARDTEAALYRITAAGRAELADTLGLEDGLGIATPSLLATASAGGRSYVLMGAAGSSSLVVAELTSAGKLVVRDHVADDLSTRFANITVLQSLTIAGRIFVVAGGSDAGLTVMEMLPGGRLLHLASLADSYSTTLAQPVGLALAASGSGFDILVASATEAGVTKLRFETGALTAPQVAAAGGGTLTGGAGSDLLIGGAGADTLVGGAGDDILVSGGGSNRLTGGAGADLFVISAGAGTTTITDFQPGIDQLDLSFLGRIYTLEALAPRLLSNGIELRHGSQILHLLSSGGGPIALASLTPDKVFGLWHPPVISPQPIDAHLPGKDRGDIITGSAGNDRLVGTEFSDWIMGKAGNDLLLGGGVDARHDPLSAGVYRLYEAVFGRAPDLPGLQSWTSKLVAGQLTLADTAGHFTRSAEFQRTYGNASDRDFVTLLYRNVLDRAPDAEGQEFWIGRLAGGQPRSTVVLAFSESAEFVTKTLAPALTFSLDGIKAQWTDNAFRLYLAVFDRLPDQAGLDYWTDAMAGGRTLPQVVSWFISSPEFQKTYGATSNASFITLLYRNVLDRTPDAEGLAFWSGRLAAGMSRADVVLGFSESAEFVKATRSQMIAFLRQGGGRDVLEGGAGNDTLFGGAGADRFVFDKADGAGTDRVAGLEPWDELELRGFGYTSSAQIMARFTQVGSDLHFSDQGLTILFPDTDRSMLHGGMFLF